MYSSTFKFREGQLCCSDKDMSRRVYLEKWRKYAWPGP